MKRLHSAIFASSQQDLRRTVLVRADEEAACLHSWPAGYMRIEQCLQIEALGAE